MYGVDSDVLTMVARELGAVGTVSIPISLILPSDIVSIIKRGYVELPEEMVGSSSGKSDEAHYTYVRRVMRDEPGKEPVAFDSDTARAIVRSLTSGIVDAALRAILSNTPGKAIRRIQYNRLPVGGYIAKHCDKFANPSYDYVVSILLNDEFEGGEFIVLNSEGIGSPFEMKAGRAVITTCTTYHLVTNVTKGERNSFVFFYGDASGINRIDQDR